MTNSGEHRAGSLPTLACLHAHHANIAPIDELFSAGAVEVVHYVDPGLLRRITADPPFPAAAQGARVAGHLDWIADAGCDAIVVTCTAYSARAGETAGAGLTPVLTIDGPFFAELAARGSPTDLVFTNPGTVEPSMRRLRSALGGASPEIRPVVIPDAFHLVMGGRVAEYEAHVAAGLQAIIEADRTSAVAVAQLSMVGAARRAAAETGKTILTPLDPLARRLAALLGIAASGRS